MDNGQSLLPEVRNLSGDKATIGNNETNEDVLRLITIPILNGYAIRKVKAFNDRIYLPRYGRNYWLGTKYYHMDNFNYLPTRDTCLYRMDSNERKNLEYVDGSPIYDIIYQCQRYVQYCCGLTCCLNEFSKT
ncbi:CX module family protein [Acanthocheilonema viteae]